MLTKPSNVTPIPQRDAGGDNEVPRDGKGRPLVWVPCENCEQTGRVPSEKKPPPATIQCPKCKGKGAKEKAYTRVTSYIDVIEDKSNLMAWGKRMVLVGVAKDPTFMDGVLDYFEQQNEADDEADVKAAKDWLNRRAESCATVAGASEKAEKGTHLHGLSELVDLGQELPDDISFGDVIDMDAYKRATTGFKIIHMEKLIVLDEIQCAGTPDRVSEWQGDEPLIAPDGTVFEPGTGELLITDLKTGSVEYGGLKMAMQLSIYSRGLLYDYKAKTRTPFAGPINQKWGIIMHVPAGSGEATLYWADLELGWEAVQVAGQVRRLRSRGRKALSQLVQARVDIAA